LGIQYGHNLMKHSSIFLISMLVSSEPHHNRELWLVWLSMTFVSVLATSKFNVLDTFNVVDFFLT